ncbi:MAG: hypothetical protein OEY08_00995 [Gammaproteobacteria bacterium]|nr:hypothetical protein [Gammaproteobacteria bacterium]
MRYEISISALAAAAICGCAAQPGGPGLAGYADVRPQCGQGNAPRTVTINVTRDDFGVNPPRLCVRPGDTIRFKVVGNPNSVRVDVESKPITPASWLSGSTALDGSFEVRAPADAEGTYFYDISVPGYGTIDPMISVDR